jgi:pseudouridine-5'-phosphate glycosidase
MTPLSLPADLDLAPNVAAALANKLPVVALESTIIAHGMPYPANLATGQELEALVVEEGAVPATIAVIDGRIKIGLTETELAQLARGRATLKATTHDLPFAVSRKRDAATTVAATMRIASMVGIRVFGTGGIGGVHRGARETFDISADITELGRTSVAVCAGIKSILDLAATLEALETAGVPVIGVGCDEFPAFYSRSSGLPTPLQLDSPQDVASFLQVKWRLGLAGGALVARPIPEEDEVPADEIRATIESAVDEAARRGIAGKAVTPFLLEQVSAATGGRSLAANIALVKNNVRLAAQVAVALREAER